MILVRSGYNVLLVFRHQGLFQNTKAHCGRGPLCVRKAAAYHLTFGQGDGAAKSNQQVLGY